MTTSFLSRLDQPEIEKLSKHTGPVDALNLVSFSSMKFYQWYGILLSPLVLLRGGKPEFVAKNEKSLYGENTFDELVIIRYPSVTTFNRILTGRYYSLLNRFRERGVSYFEFSFTQSFRESSELWKKGLRLVVRFNYQDGTFGNIIDKITNILGKYPVLQLYASKKIGDIPFQGTARPSDPNPSNYEGMVIFSILEHDPEKFVLEDNDMKILKSVIKDISMDVYRSVSIWESLPWSKK